MQLEGLPERGGMPLDKVKSAIGDAKVLAALPAKENERSERSFVIATPERLAIVTEYAPDNPLWGQEIITEWEAWGEVEVGTREAGGWDRLDEQHGLPVRVSDRSFLAQTEYRADIDAFRHAARRAGAKEIIK